MDPTKVVCKYMLLQGNSHLVQRGIKKEKEEKGDDEDYTHFVLVTQFQLI